MRALVIELLTETLEAPLLGLKAACRRARSLGFQRAMHPLMAAVLLGMARRDSLQRDPQLQSPHRQRRQTTDAIDAKGGPLSERIAAGNPYSLNTRSMCLWTCAPVGGLAT
jgi:hypothetical protein